MEQAYLDRFLIGTGFSPEDQAEARAAYQQLGVEGRAALTAAAAAYTRADFDTAVLDRLLADLGGASGLHPYTLWLLALIECSEPVYERTADKELFFATFADVRYKVRECREVYGICGVFVGFWYPIFFRDQIVKLGRLEYESCPFPFHGSFRVCGVTVAQGDPVLSIHIPSSGEAFDRAARMASYRAAYDHFRCRERGVPLVAFCESWLLYPPYGEALPEGSRIRDFQRDFHLAESGEYAEFEDGWRVYGSRWQDPVSDWPEDSTLRRALKAHFAAGKAPGFGLGLLVFDGERLLSRTRD